LEGVAVSDRVRLCDGVGVVCNVTGGSDEVTALREDVVAGSVFKVAVREAENEADADTEADTVGVVSRVAEVD